MFGLFGSKPKFKLHENMEVELEIKFPDGLRSYFTKILEASKKKARIATPKEGTRPIPINSEDIVKLIALIDDTIFEVNLKVTNSIGGEFVALVSKNITRLDTVLKKFGKNQPVELETSVPLDFRAITTSHLQRGMTKKITKEQVELVTNLPIPGGTPLKLTFRIPGSPPVECEGTSAKSEPLEEDSKKSKTIIEFSEKVVESDSFDTIKKYMVHYEQRDKRRKELEEQEKENGNGNGKNKNGKK